MANFIIGDYFVRFESNLGTNGLGTVTVRNGLITGGDGGYRYRGFVVTKGGCHYGRIAIERLDPLAVSLFGAVERFDIEISGKAERDMFAFSGCVSGAEHLRVRIVLFPALRVAA